MDWKAAIRRMGVASIPVLGIIAFAIFSPCQDDLFIGFCGLGNILFIGLAVSFWIVFFVINLIASRSKSQERSSVKKSVLRFVIIFILAIPATGVAIWLGLHLWMAKQLAVHEIKTTQSKNSFEIANFYEEPIVDRTTNKFTGIDVEFELIASETGVYSMVVGLGDFFGDYMVDRVDKKPFKAHTPTKFQFSLRPTKDFNKIKPNGPYYLLIELWPITDKKSDGYELNISGDKNYKNPLGEPVKYIQELRTKPYFFTDFR